MFSQNYDPFGNGAWSVAAAAAPIAVLLSSLAFFRLKSHWAALIGFLAALFVATLVFGMPPRSALAAAGYGAASGLFPVGWTLLAAAFFHQLNDKRGIYPALRDSAVAAATPDRRVLAIAGTLAAKKSIPPSAGTLPTTGGLFVGLVVGVILIVGGLTFFPALALGPIAEHFAAIAGTTFAAN